MYAGTRGNHRGREGQDVLTAWVQEGEKVVPGHRRSCKVDAGAR